MNRLAAAGWLLRMHPVITQSSSAFGAIIQSITSQIDFPGRCEIAGINFSTDGSRILSAVHILRPFSRRAGLVSTSPLLLKQTPFDLISLHGLSAPHLRFQLLAFEPKLSSRRCTTTVDWHYCRCCGLFTAGRSKRNWLRKGRGRGLLSCPGPQLLNWPS